MSCAPALSLSLSQHTACEHTTSTPFPSPQVLRTGRHVLVSDSDVAWVKDPLPLLDTLREGGATIGASTDCLDVASDRDKSPRAVSTFMCGHSPGNQYGAVFNTGVIWFAAGAAPPLAFLRQWAVATLSLQDQWSDDQGVFNRLITTERAIQAGDTPFYPVRSAGLGGRVVHAPFGLRMAPLPAEFFCSGHLVGGASLSSLAACAPNSPCAPSAVLGAIPRHWRLGARPPASASALTLMPSRHVC